MKKTALLSLLLFTFIGCSESFDVDLSFGEKESINPGIENAFAMLTFHLEKKNQLILE